MRELKIDSAKVEQKLVKFIRKQIAHTGFNRVLVGLSGGLDSSLALYLCCRAVGEDNVFALILPYKTTPAESVNSAKLIARRLRVKTRFIDITPQVDAYFKNFPGADKVRRGNKMARERMSILYDRSKELGALVAGTSNKTELLLGYATLYGDIACAFNPLGGLYKTQVRQLAHDAGLPDEIIKKPPTAELWPGQSDEGELGLTYAMVDRFLHYLVDKKFSDKRLLGLGFKKNFLQKVKRRIAENAFKRQLPPIARIYPR